MSIAEKITGLRAALPQHVELIAVSKTYPPSAVLEAYRAGQRAFGENRPQDIRWHQIGGLQSNKVKYIAPFVAMIHSVESAKLLDVIQKEAVKNDRTIDVLLEIRIAREASKHGWSEKDLIDYLQTGAYRNLNSVRFRGLMGVATHTEDQETIRAEFTRLHELFVRLGNEYFDRDFDTLSMGMTSDYPIAVSCGSTMVRIGSYIFGARNYL